MKRTVAFIVISAILVCALTSCALFGKKEPGASAPPETETAERTEEAASLPETEPDDTVPPEPVDTGSAEPAAPEITVVEVFHAEEPVPMYPDVEEYKRVYSIPAISCEGENAAAFNETLYQYCQNTIDDFNKPENDDLIVKMWYSFRTDYGIAAINIQFNAAVAYSGVNWSHSHIYYFDSVNDRQIYDWRDYLGAIGYQPDKMEDAIMKTDRVVEFMTPIEDDWAVYSLDIESVMLGGEESEVIVSCDYKTWDGSGSGTFTLEIPTSQLLELYGQ